MNQTPKKKKKSTIKLNANTINKVKQPKGDSNQFWGNKASSYI